MSWHLIIGLRCQFTTSISNIKRERLFLKGTIISLVLLREKCCFQTSLLTVPLLLCKIFFYYC